MSSWVAVDAVLEPVEEEFKVWDRAELEQRTNRVREYVPRSQQQHENVNSAKTHCPNGHPYNEANTYYRKSGKGRECKVCRRERRKW